MNVVIVVKNLIEKNLIYHVNKKVCERMKKIEEEYKKMKIEIKILRHSNNVTNDEKYIGDKKVYKKKIPACIHNIVWDMHMGKESKVGICCCCKNEQITFVNFHCRHIISKYNGGSTHINNLLPICPSCNGSMGTINLNDFKNKYGLI